MSDYNLFLAALNVYPSIRQINEASTYAKKITIAYVRKIDPNAIVIIEDGDVDIYTNSNFKGLYYNAQCVFDEAFAEMIEKIQAAL